MIGTETARSIQVFDHMFLSGADVARTNSGAMCVSLQNVSINVVLIQAAGLSATDKLILRLEGSYDGRVWSVARLSTLVEFTSSGTARLTTSAPMTVDYGFLRLRATLGGSTTKALFDAWLTFAD